MAELLYMYRKNQNTSNLKDDWEFSNVNGHTITPTQKVLHGERYDLFVEGECYNVNELLEEEGMEDLADHDFMVAIEKLFIRFQTDLFAKLRGRYAIVIYDKVEQVVYGARDHFGIQTLYYVDSEDMFATSSDKKALHNLLTTEQVDETALQHYLSFQYVPEPFTMTKVIKVVKPGTYFKKQKGKKVQFESFWNVHFRACRGSKDEMINSIRKVLYEQVEKRINVNEGEAVGSFLSGGIDSTLVVAIAKEIEPNLKTFSVGFSREGFSEVDLAKESAEEIDVENISRIVSAEEYVEKIPEIIWHLEDPLADPSCIPLYFVAEEAKKHVDAVLSGEGSDEFFGGYNIYHEPNSLRLFQYMPKVVKKAIKSVAEKLPEQTTGRSFLIRGSTPLRERYIGNAKMFEEEEKRTFLKSYDASQHYKMITEKLYEEVQHLPLVTQMQYIDIHTWLRGDILFKANRVAQAHDLAIRLPFVDVETFEVACKLPVEFRVNKINTKYLLRLASEGIIPESVVQRKKLGFPVPIRHWLKNELHSWAQNLIKESEVDEYIDKSYVEQLLQVHCDGKGDYSRKLWTIFMFFVWHQVFIEKKYNFSKKEEELMLV